MTPEERRKKYPLRPVVPFAADKEAVLRERTEEWLVRPRFTSPVLDITYYETACLFATIDRLRDGLHRWNAAHGNACRATILGPDARCTCGLSAALNGVA